MFFFFNRETYRQSLPDNWLQLIMGSPQLFSIADSLLDNKIIYANSSTSVSIPVENVPHTNEIVSNGVPAIQPHIAGLNGNQIEASEPQIEESNYKYMDKLMLPWSEKYWNLYITNPKSTVEIWGRLIGPDYSVSVLIGYF